MSDAIHEPAKAAEHLFLAGELRRDRHARLAALPLPEPVRPEIRLIDAHRGSGGPYTVAGALIRALVPDALTRRPELVAAHEVEILTVAPELRDLVPATQETLTSLAVPNERTRFYSRMRTLRIAHGLKEFLDELLRGDRPADDLPRHDRPDDVPPPGELPPDGELPPRPAPYALIVDDLDHADPTDQEFVAVLLRRMDPA